MDIGRSKKEVNLIHFPASTPFSGIASFNCHFKSTPSSFPVVYTSVTPPSPQQISPNPVSHSPIKIVTSPIKIIQKNINQMLSKSPTPIPLILRDKSLSDGSADVISYKPLTQIKFSEGSQAIRKKILLSSSPRTNSFPQVIVSHHNNLKSTIVSTTVSFKNFSRTKICSTTTTQTLLATKTTINVQEKSILLSRHPEIKPTLLQTLKSPRITSAPKTIVTSVLPIVPLNKNNLIKQLSPNTSIDLTGIQSSLQPISTNQMGVTLKNVAKPLKKTIVLQKPSLPHLNKLIIKPTVSFSKPTFNPSIEPAKSISVLPLKMLNSSNSIADNSSESKIGKVQVSVAMLSEGGEVLIQREEVRNKDVCKNGHFLSLKQNIPTTSQSYPTYIFKTSSQSSNASSVVPQIKFTASLSSLSSPSLIIPLPISSSSLSSSSSLVITTQSLLSSSSSIATQPSSLITLEAQRACKEDNNSSINTKDFIEIDDSDDDADDLDAKYSLMNGGGTGRCDGVVVVCSGVKLNGSENDTNDKNNNIELE